MKILYLILTMFVVAGMTEQAQAQHLNKQETMQLKKYFDKHLLKVFTASKIKAESKVERNSNFSTLSDSIHTFSKFAEADPYAQGINYHFTFDVVAGNAIITEILIKIFDPSFPVDNITATPTYDSQQRISKITMNTVFGGFPINILNYYYNYDQVGNTTSIILESPGVFGGETTYEGDSVQFTYGSGNRVSAYNAYYLLNGDWVFNNGVSDLVYDGNNIISVNQLQPGGDTLAPVPTVLYRLSNIEWYNNSMPASLVNPLGVNTTNVETELTGIEIVVADEDYKSGLIAFVQDSYIDGDWVDGTQIRTFEQASNRFSIFDAFYETGDFIYTQITNYYYNAQDQLSSTEILYDLGFGDPVPLDKTEYEHNEYGLTKSENFMFDQGQWISNGVSTFNFVVIDDELHEYTETYVYGSDYESFKTVFFPSDVLETSVNETLLTADVINVYPTVVKGNLTISFPQHSQVQDLFLSVWDLNGKLMLSQRFDFAAQQVDFNVSKLSGGLYLLNVQMSEGMRTIRFVKE
jgi:hypothetical protein